MHYRHGQPISGTQYRFIRELGAGGHGTVYAVEHTFLEAPAVMKLLHAELVDRGDLAERMTREAKTLAKLRHPNIVEVRDGGITAETPARPYFVMEALNGMPLRDLLRHVRGPRGVGVTPALRIMSGVLEGLEHAHRAGVIHRDIKPDNIFLHRTATDVTVPKILDFGIAHILIAQRTTGRYFLGTPRYAAPEQLRGDPPTPRTDIYAAGLLLWEMLTGEAPFAHLKEVGEILKGQLEEPLPFVSVKCPEAPPYLANFVAQMVAKNPDERPQTAFAAAVALREIRGRLEAKEARVLNNTGFKTEPTPMENMLFGATPHHGGTATQQTQGAATPNVQSMPGMSGVVQDTIVDTPRMDGGGGGLKTTVRQAPRVVGGGVQHPMVSAETEVDTPRNGPSTPPMGGGIDRNAKTNTSAPFMPPSKPNFDTERLLAGIVDPAAYAETDAAPAGMPGGPAVGPASLAPPMHGSPSQGPEERTTGAIAMSRDPSMVVAPPREQVFKKQVIAFCVTLLVFAVISVPVLWKLKKEYGPGAHATQAAQATQPTTTTTAVAAAPSPSPSPAPSPSSPPAPSPAPSAAEPAAVATPSALPAAAPKPSVTTRPRATVTQQPAAALAPAAAPAPGPAPKPAAPKPAPKPGDPSSVGFD